jgi:hypothetical protein
MRQEFGESKHFSPLFHIFPLFSPFRLLWVLSADMEPSEVARVDNSMPPLG